MRRPIALSLLLIANFLCATALMAEENVDPVVIAGITFTGDRIEDPERLLESMAIVVGEPLNRKRIREGAMTLFAGGNVEYFKITSEQVQGGLRLNLDVMLKSRIVEFKVVGVSFLWRKRIEDWFELRPGMAVSAAGIEAGSRRALARIRDRGWLGATIEASVDYDRLSNTVVVEVEVDLGVEETIASINIVGLEYDDVERVTPEFKIGKVLNQNLVDRLKDDVEVELRRIGFWEGIVAKIEKRGEAGRVDLVFHVNPGRQYLLVIDSPTEAAEVIALAAVPDPADGLHPAQTEALREQIRENLQLEGYLMPDVEVELETHDDKGVLTLRCDPGSVLEVFSVEFPGAEKVSVKVLRRSVGIRKGRTEGFNGQEVSISTLDRDRRVLETLYRKRGFKDVVVDPALISRDHEGGVKISFSITEGQRWIVDSLRLENFPVEAIAVIEETKLIVTSGSPWNPEKVSPLCRTLEGILASNGYPHGVVNAQVSEQNSRARLVVRAEPGPYVLFGEIVISGLKHTKESVVSEILQRAGLVSGRAYSYAAIIEVQSQLYRHGLFRAVEIVPIPGQERRARRGLVVRCEEGEQRSVLFGVGWDTEESIRVTLGWGHLNLFGGAHAVSVEARASSRQLRFQAGLREYSLFKTGIPGYAVIYKTNEEFASYSQDRFGIWFEVGDRRRRPFRPWFRIEYQMVEPDAPDDVLSELEREEQRIRLASVLPVIEWDTRDDPLSPKRGFLASASLEYAFPVLKAETEFLKLQASYSHYRPMLHGQGALGLRFGAIEPLGVDTGEPPNLQIPLATRFFAGGRTTHRAFAIDRLGIPGETIDEEGKAIGGNALMLVNLEYIRPVWGLLSASLFLDGGNVWASTSNFDLSGMRWGLGFGFRYETPAGPFRLEYGRKLDPQPGESSGQFFFSFGVPF